MYLISYGSTTNKALDLQSVNLAFLEYAKFLRFQLSTNMSVNFEKYPLYELLLFISTNFQEVMYYTEE